MHQGWKCALFVLSLMATSFATGCGSSNANLRIFNAYPSPTALDMVIDSKTVTSGVSYAAASSYVSVNSGSRHLQVEASGGSTIVADENVSPGSGSYNTVLVAQSGTTLLTDSHSAPASGDVSVRVINACLTLGAADIYIVAPGTDTTSVTPTFSNLTYPSASGYASITAGTYEVMFVVPGSKSVVFTSSSLSLSSGQVRTVVGMNGLGGGFTAPVLSDFN